MSGSVVFVTELSVVVDAGIFTVYEWEHVIHPGFETVAKPHLATKTYESTPFWTRLGGWKRAKYQLHPRAIH